LALDLTSRPPNGFLSALSADDYELIRPHLRTADLPRDKVLVESGDTLRRAYMPLGGVISIVIEMAKGEHVQIAMIGRDSIFGVFSALGDALAITGAVVLVPGLAVTIEIEQLRAAADKNTRLRSILMRHGLSIYAQVQQTAGCNATHSVESRFARCLLQIHDLSCSRKFVLTQESMAQMIGARRNSVSLAASNLQEAGVLQYSRGHIDIRNVDAVKTTACECYGVVRLHCERLLGEARHRKPGGGPGQ
jgi:CRP-like cAMP-binding protein